MSSTIPNTQWICVGFKRVFFKCLQTPAAAAQCVQLFWWLCTLPQIRRVKAFNHLSLLLKWLRWIVQLWIHCFCWNGKIAQADIDFSCPRWQISKWSVYSEFGILSSQPSGYLLEATVVTLTSSSQITAFYPTISLKVKTFKVSKPYSGLTMIWGFFLNELLATLSLAVATGWLDTA